jgi:Trk K+ transport system NAD-binding subunit
MGVHAVISASDLAAPAFAGTAVGVEITQTLRVKGQEYSMIRLTVAPGSILDSSSIETMQTVHNIDIVLHGRGDNINVHPEGSIIIQPGDTLVIFARHDKIIDIVARNRRTP